MKPIQIQAAEFEKEVLQHKGKVIVDFWADWCGPCRLIAPILEEIGEEKPELKICKVNADEADALMVQYNVVSIPMLILFENGKIVGQTVGYQPKTILLHSLELK